MKDMKAIITRAMLAFIAFIMIIIVYAFVGNSEDKGKIRKDQDRMVEYVLENYELKNGDEIKKIKIIILEKHENSFKFPYIFKTQTSFQFLNKI